jgi:lipopolysaccharide/colanic/teichoic acid biosynthesis glycosyltransferase
VTGARYERLKRALDLVVAALSLLLLLPLMGFLAILVWANLGRPVLFRQVRPGRHGVPFVLVKFRTMRDIDEARGLVTDADRLTRFGQHLRASSMDELPSLWNVVRGQMSLVGPRPLLMSYLERYTPEQARRHDRPPGLTGLAQVRGRNSLSWEEKLALDVWYVDNCNLLLDLRILRQTVFVVLRRQGIRAEGSATAPEFLGTLGEDRAGG